METQLLSRGQNLMVLPQKTSLTELSHRATGFSMFCKIKFVLIYTFLKIGFRHCCYCTWRVKFSRDISEICLTFFPMRRPTVPSLDSPLVWITGTPSLTVRLSHGVIYIKKVFFQKETEADGKRVSILRHPVVFFGTQVTTPIQRLFCEAICVIPAFSYARNVANKRKRWRFYVLYIYLNQVLPTKVAIGDGTGVKFAIRLFFSMEECLK